MQVSGAVGAVLRLSLFAIGLVNDLSTLNGTGFTVR
jgi:hypothetical protein